MRLRLRTFLERAPLIVRIGLHVGLGLFGLLAVLAYLGIQAARTTADGIVQHRLVIAQILAARVDGDLEARKQAMRLTALELEPTLGNLQPEEARRALNHLRDNLGPGILGVALLDASGRPMLVQPSAGIPVEAITPDAETVVRSLASGEPVVSAARPWVDRPVVTLAVPVGTSTPNTGAARGDIACLIDASQLGMASAIMAAEQLGDTIHVELVDQRGTILVASEPVRLLQPEDNFSLLQPLIAAGSPGQRAASVLYTAPDDRSQRRHILAFVPLDGASWGLVLGSAEDETFAPVRLLEREFLLLGGLGLLATLLLLVLTASSISEPLKALRRAAERIAGGDLGVAAPAVGVAEVRALADTFERMRCQLWSQQRELAVGKSRYEGIFRAITDPVYTVDTELRITSINPAVERLLGWREGEVVGKRCTDLVQLVDEHGHPTCDLVCPLLVGLGGSRSARRLPDAQELVATTTGRTLTVATARSPIRDEAGQVVGMVHILRDVSAEAKATRLKDQFVASVSHELRTPLGHIKGFTTTLLRKDARWDPAKARHFLEIIDSAADRLAEQIDNLLDVSRISAGGLRVEKCPVDVADLARGVVERMAPRSDRHRFVLDLSSPLSMAAGDRARIEQVLSNLLDNAVKYSPGGGEIVVEARTAGSSVQVRVCDEGLGVPEGEREAIFERFHRSSAPAVQRIRGSGLGLAICRGIVEAHGGAIWAERRPNRGSIFTFTLPIWSEHATPAATMTMEVADADTAHLGRTA